MNRTKALTLPSFAAWAAVLAFPTLVIVASLALGRPKLLLFGLAAIFLAAALAALALRRGTGGWLAIAVLLVSGLAPGRISMLWRPSALGGAFDLVVTSTVAIAAVAWLGRMLTQRAGRSNGVVLLQLLLLIAALGGMLVRSGEYIYIERPLRALVWMFVPMLAFWIVSSSRLSRWQAVNLARVMVGAGAAMAALGLRWPLHLSLVNKAGLAYWASTVGAFRTITPVGGPGLSALALGMMVPVALALAISDRRGWRALWAFCALLQVAAVAFSVSRTGIVSALCSLLFFVWLNRGLLARRLAVVALAVCVAAGTVTLVVLNYRDYTNFARLTRLLDPDNPSDRLRITSARAAFEVGGRRPILGSGIGRFYPREPGGVSLVEGVPSARDPHSLYLLAFAEMGLPGLVLALLLVCRPLLDFLRERRRADAATSMLLSAFACAAVALILYSVASCALFAYHKVATVAWWVLGLGYQFVQTRAERTSA